MIHGICSLKTLSFHVYQFAICLSFDIESLQCSAEGNIWYREIAFVLNMIAAELLGLGTDAPLKLFKADEVQEQHKPIFCLATDLLNSILCALVFSSCLSKSTYFKNAEV